MKRRIKDTDRYILSTMPVFWAPMTEGHHSDGATFLSSDGRGHVCTVTGALWTPQGRQFDGIDDKIVLPSSITKGLSALTIVGWIKPTRLPGNEAIFSDWAADADCSCRLELQDVGATSTWQLRTGLKGETTAWDWAGATTTTNLYGVWTHIALTWDSSIRRWYINGVADGTAAYSDTQLKVAPSEVSSIGCNKASVPSQLFKGIIGEILVYNRPSTPLEIQRLYLATKWRY